jgi:hypothetical protein
VEGADCVRPDHWPADVGGEAPAAFQNQNKECPLFAVLYAVLLLRALRKEWAPINTRRAEVRPEAVALMGQIQVHVDRSQCLDRRIDDKQTIVDDVAAWQNRRNDEGAKIRWMFTTQNAREKLRRAYPVKES